MHPQRLGARVQSACLEGTARLSGFSLHFHKRGMDGSGKCNIQAGDSGVYVAVYTMDSAEKPALDVIEHCGIGYDVTTIDVPGFGSCFTYAATETHVVDDLVPYCWYHELVVAGCRFLGLPEDYRDGISAVRRLRDPDSARRQRNWALVRSMR